MPGCASLPAACASLRKRASIAAAWRSPSTSSLRMVLIATVRRMPGSNPRYTTPMAPWPSTSVISYLPRWWGVVISGRSPLGLRAGILCFFAILGGTHAAAAEFRYRTLQPLRQGHPARADGAGHQGGFRRRGEGRAALAASAARPERVSARGHDRHLRRHALRLRLRRPSARERGELHHDRAQIEFPGHRAGRRALRRSARGAPGTHYPGLGRCRDPRRGAAQTGPIRRPRRRPCAPARPPRGRVRA